jgi:hypothetical protein
LIPVTFTVNGTPALTASDALMLSGSASELGNWATTWDGAIGPVTIPAAGSGLLTVSVPRGASIQFKFFVLHSDGSVTWENGANHSFAVPSTGVGEANVSWQN